MAKVKRKKKASAKKSGKKKSAGKRKDTIISTVVSIFTSTPGISSEACVKKIQSKFPDSAFDEGHFTFYRNKVQKDPYNLSLPALKTKKPSKKKASKKKSGKKKASKKKR